ncbi:hypothetical protein AVEN_15478-1 [Araneus ventricosus]|uniref:Uncharacterized protein n=1 Tax=Araneus ventricosus TaxID=182803 RepID=A0A4Y2VEE9_ARAVE|nr:hypothetical protein AVEN_15478-1 [Araneus ventricosus]
MCSWNLNNRIIAILLVAVFCCEATYLPATFGLGGVSYAGALGYPASPVAPYSAYAAAAVPGAVKVTYVAPSDLGNYVVVSDVAAPAPVPAPAAAASYAVVDPAPVIKDATSRYVAPLKSYGNIAYVVKK